jgi:hypothetical protein
MFDGGRININKLIWMKRAGECLTSSVPVGILAHRLRERQMDPRREKGDRKLWALLKKHRNLFLHPIL